MLLEVPVDRGAETGAEGDGWEVSEGLRSAGQVSFRVEDVAGAGWMETRFVLEVQDAGEGGVKLVQVVTVSCADVEDFAANDEGIGGAGEEIGSYNVADEGEVAALKTIAEDGWYGALEHVGGEAGDDAGVRGVGGLLGAEDVEVTEADAFESVAVPEAFDVLLAGEFLRGVRREWAREHALVFWLDRLVAVGRGGGCVNDAMNTGVAGGDEDAQCAVYVGDVALFGIADGAGDGGEGRLMEDEVNAAAALAEAIGFVDVHEVEFYVVEDRLKVLHASSGEIVDTAHVVTASDEFLRERRADEAGDAGDEIGCHAFCALPRAST